MGFHLTTSKQVLKSLRDLKYSRSKDYMNELTNLIGKLANDPHSISVEYQGGMTGLRKIAFGESPQMRIIFAIYNKEYYDLNKDNFEDIEFEEDFWDNNDGIIDVVLLMTREDCEKKIYSKSVEEKQNLLR